MPGSIPGLLTQEATPIGIGDDAQSLHDRLADLGARLLVLTIPRWATGDILPRPQPAVGVSYAGSLARKMAG
jgi:methionyl-tRNA formyltransferase